MAIGALTRKRCKPFHYSTRTVVQCRTGNRRRRTVPATGPNRATVEIALACMYATETRAQPQFFRSAAGHQAKLNVLNPAAAIGA